MSYRVRTPEGELEFASLYEISAIVRASSAAGRSEVPAVRMPTCPPVGGTA